MTENEHQQDPTYHRKLNPNAASMYARALAQAERGRRGLQADTTDTDEECVPPSITVIIELIGDPEDLKAAGLMHPGEGFVTDEGVRILSGMIDPLRLGELVRIEHVRKVQLPREAIPLLHESRMEIRALDLKGITASRLTGKGVVVGVIDSGFDWRHSSFTRTVTQIDGTKVEESRFLAILDMSLKHGPDTGGQAFKTYTYYTQADINKGLAPGAKEADKPRTKDQPSGHGTHVAGIAAGDGSASGDCHGSDYFVGIAPEADLVGVRLRGADLPSALEFLKQQAGSRPLVVNLSMAFLESAGHDGTNTHEKTIDAFVGNDAAQNNAARLLVAATGNYGNHRRHIKREVPVSGSVEIQFWVYEKDEDAHDLEFWYPAGQQLNVSLRTPGGVQTEQVMHGMGRKEFLVNDQPPPLTSPKNLAAEAGDKQVTLTWEPCAGVSGYDVHRASGGSGTPSLLASLVVGARYVDTGLTNGQSYTYFVTARGSAGASSTPSNQVQRTPQLPAPLAPLHLVCAPGHQAVSLHWDAALGATSYEVWGSTGTSGAWSLRTTVADTAFTDTGRSNGTSYFYFVKAKNGTGVSPESIRVGTTPDAASDPPPPPTGLSSTIVDHQVVLSWTASAGATSYEIQRQIVLLPGETVAVGSSTGTTFKDTDDLANAIFLSYRYVVLARNGAGKSAPSDEHVVSLPPLPSAPTNFSAVAYDQKVLLAWNHVPGNMGYIIGKSYNPGGPYTEFDTSTDAKFTDSGLTNGVTYYYAVRAKGVSGKGAYSSEMKATPVSTATPRARASITMNEAETTPPLLDPYCVVNVSHHDAEYLFPKAWTLTFSNPSAQNPVELHGWVMHYDHVDVDDGLGGKWKEEPVVKETNDPLGRSKPPRTRAPVFVIEDSEFKDQSRTTIVIPATAQKAISVANYAFHKNCCDGLTTSVHRSSCAGPIRGNAYQKPELAAPGTNIMSALAGGTGVIDTRLFAWLNPICCRYVSKMGTSMAAPHVTGAIALMLQEFPDLTRDEIVTHLQGAAEARMPGMDRDFWGHGALDVDGALRRLWAAKGKTPPASTPVAGPSAARLASVRAGAQVGQWTSPETLLEAVHAHLRGSPEGELCAALISRHFSEVRRLVNVRPRIATMWHRGEGPRLIHLLVAAAVVPGTPAYTMEEKQREYLQRLLGQLQRHGGPALRTSIERHGATLLGVVERFLAAPKASQSSQVGA